MDDYDINRALTRETQVVSSQRAQTNGASIVHSQVPLFNAPNRVVQTLRCIRVETLAEPHCGVCALLWSARL